MKGSILDTVFRRNRQAEKVKASGKVDRFYADDHYDSTFIESGYSPETDESGYKIDYSKMKR